MLRKYGCITMNASSNKDTQEWSCTGEGEEGDDRVDQVVKVTGQHGVHLEGGKTRKTTM